MYIKPIRTLEDKRNVLDRIWQLLDAEIDAAEIDELEVLVTLVEAFERINYPILKLDPIDEIKLRLEQLGVNKECYSDDENAQMFTLFNSYAPDVIFSGELLASVYETNTHTGRWIELNLYGTYNGKLIVQKVEGLLSTCATECKSLVKICFSEAEVVVFLGQSHLAQKLYQKAKIEDFKKNGYDFISFMRRNRSIGLSNTSDSSSSIYGNNLMTNYLMDPTHPFSSMYVGNSTDPFSSIYTESSTIHNPMDSICSADYFNSMCMDSSIMNSPISSISSTDSFSSIDIGISITE